MHLGPLRHLPGAAPKTGACSKSPGSRTIRAGFRRRSSWLRSWHSRARAGSFSSGVSGAIRISAPLFVGGVRSPPGTKGKDAEVRPLRG